MNSHKDNQINDNIDINRSSPETVFLWNMLRLTYHPVSYQPVWYQGPLAGSEFLTYNAKKLYLSLTTQFSFVPEDTVRSKATYYDTNNAVSMEASSINIVYDSAAITLKWLSNSFETKNMVFSRIVVSGALNYFTFLGYRLNLP